MSGFKPGKIERVAGPVVVGPDALSESQRVYGKDEKSQKGAATFLEKNSTP